MKTELIKKLNEADINTRLECLDLLIKKSNFNDKSFVDVNNHIHTWYSFSPYSPTKAVWMALTSGLSTAGIMDHDSVAGAREFLQAGKIAKLPVTIGAELRVSMKNTKISGRRINNPDQVGIAYMAIHGIPHTKIDETDKFLKTIRGFRDLRNRKMIDKINSITQKYVGSLDYDKDVLPLSKNSEGGSVTERHLLFALAEKIIDVYGKGGHTAEFILNTLRINLSERNKEYLSDKENKFYQYDLLGALKSDLVERFYIPAEDECPNAEDVVGFVKEIGGISAYAYLGDVADSVTGDKKAAKFEDAYLDELFSELKRIGFNAITYMPSRNTQFQLKRIKKLCDYYGFMEISGEDINSPRQKFVCAALRSEEYKNLVTSAYALINHEKFATKDKDSSLFSDASIKKYPDLKERLKVYGYLKL